jgi:hypothetical protein
MTFLLWMCSIHSNTIGAVGAVAIGKGLKANPVLNFLL